MVQCQQTLFGAQGNLGYLQDIDPEVHGLRPCREPVPPAELKTSPRKNYYLPMHGAIKESSTTTKLRVVFDASAKSISEASLNDTLLPGPSLYLTLASYLNLA